MKKLFILTASLVASLAVTATADAQIIVNGGTAYGTPTDPSTVTTYTGLNEQVIHLNGNSSTNDAVTQYNNPPLDNNAFASDAGISNVAAYVASFNPASPGYENSSYNFVNTVNGYTYSGGNGPTNAYLGADAAGNALTDSLTIQGTIFNSTGYIDITPAEAGDSFTFTINSADDAARLSIGGQTVIENNYLAVFGSSGLDYSNTADVTFATAGLYSVDLLYFQNGGGANLSYTATPDSFGDSVNYVAAAPEPSTWALLLGGVTALVVINRRRSVKV